MAGFDIEDTIAAIASAPGPAFRGIVRVSGPQATSCVAKLFQPATGPPITAFTATTGVAGKLLLPPSNEATNDSLDEIVVPADLLLWPTHKSYTRQPTAELHTIGSMPILQLLLKTICNAGARLANPGEFTLRAFLSGRIDLTQAEAVLAVIDSTGDQQLDTALQQLAGGLAGPLGAIRNQLLSTLAELEAGLDFVEEDIEFISQAELTAQLESIQQQLAAIEAQINQRDRVAGTTKVVLIGMPNSGKSSLFNALTESEDAIVTDVEGTTTDFISAKMVIESAQIELIDTAGFELSDEQVRGQAQSHRAEQQEQAHLTVLCIDAARGLSEWGLTQLNAGDRSPDLVVLTKSDLVTDAGEPGSNLRIKIQQSGFPGTVLATSCVDGSGISRLRAQLAVSVFETCHSDASVVSTTILRASESLREAIDSVNHALEAAVGQHGEEIVAAEIRQALEGLGQVVGTVYTDDILDLVFGRFCIGK